MSESEEYEVESEVDEIIVVGQDINEESLLKKSFSYTQEMKKIKRSKKSW